MQLATSCSSAAHQRHHWQPARPAVHLPQLHSAGAAAAAHPSSRRRTVHCCAERKEYYDYKDMPPLPLTVSRIYVPSLDHLVVDKACEERRMASLAIFYDIHKDDQYASRLTRKSAITALCMYDRDDVDEALRSPGEFPNIDLLHRVYNQGLDVEFIVEEFTPV